MSEHAERVRAVVEAGDDTSTLAASWRRCANVYGIDPDVVVPPEPDKAGWRDACERDDLMIEVARDYLDRLFHHFAEEDCGVYLANADGMILDLRTNRSLDAWEREPARWLGTTYAEQLLGTNGVGTCIAEKRLVTLRADQHLLTCYTNLDCISAPIFSPNGDVLGCVCVNQRTNDWNGRLNNFISTTVAHFARRVEIEVFARTFPNSRFVLASPIARHPCAVLALDQDDYVVGATRGARQILDLSDARMRQPFSVSDALGSPDDGASGDLARSELRLIERVLARHDGNMSAAAKEIGISRNTLYRKVAGAGLRQVRHCAR